MSTTIANAQQLRTNQHNQIHAAITGEYGLKAKIACLAAITNRIGFSFAITQQNELNPKDRTTFDESAEAFYGLAEIKPKTYNLSVIADGFVAAQLLLADAIKQPDPEDGGKRNAWAKVYFRTGPALAANVYDFRLKNEIARLMANVQKLVEVTGAASPNLDARKKALKAEYDAAALPLAQALDDHLKRVYLTIKDISPKDAWRMVTDAMKEMEVEIVDVVVPSLERLAKAQVARIESGAYATLDSGVYALMKSFHGDPVPATGT